MKFLRYCVLILMVVIVLSGCDPVRRYEGAHSDLFATAIYSIPGIESQWTDNIQILERDNYGRVLYAVCMSDSLLIKDSWEDCVLAIIVMQKSEAGSAYFYAEKNYLFKVVNNYVDLKEWNLEDFFNEEDVLALKKENDWNIPHQEENEATVCVPITVDKGKRMPNISDKIIDAQIGSNYRYVFFREDENGKTVYFITHVTECSYESYLIAFNKEGTLIDENRSIRRINQSKPEEFPIVVQEFLYENLWGR